VQLTVAICTHNPDEETFLRALDAITSQLDEIASVELIVVDNNSSPPLQSQRYLDGYQLRLISEPEPGLTAAREAAIKSAAGSVIVFVDDDNLLGSGYLVAVANAFAADGKLGLLGGRIVPEYAEQVPEWFGEFEHWLAIRRHSRELHVETTGPPFSSYFPVGAGLAVRHDLALAYLEDCSQTQRIEGRRGDALSSGEDLDLGLFALSRGYKLVVDGGLSLTHVISQGRTTEAYMERLAVGNVRSALALEQKWAPRFGTSIYPMFSMSLFALLLRSAATLALSLRSPRYKVKYRIYATLVRVRLVSGGARGLALEA
jgi:glycosyltransferase involved in cell wall biosynthesis